jgi:hypothetical protein
MPDYIDRALRPLVAYLRARYPRVRIVDARMTKWEDGFLQQSIRYQAPLAELKRCGLVTEEMLRQRKRRSACGETSIGDAFHLCEVVDAESKQECWDLDMCTESVPRDPELQTREAQRVLERIFQDCKPAPNGSAKLTD